MNIHCCGCDKEVSARLTTGAEIYPHRNDLKPLPFWKCNTCGNFVGCHHKTNNPTRPLGVIPTAELKKARQHIHKLLDPLWQSGTVRRGDVYTYLRDKLGYQYHTAEIRSVEQARKIYSYLLQFKNGIGACKE